MLGCALRAASRKISTTQTAKPIHNGTRTGEMQRIHKIHNKWITVSIIIRASIKFDYTVLLFLLLLFGSRRRRADGLPLPSHLTNTVLTDPFFAIAIRLQIVPFSTLRNGCVSSAPALSERFIITHVFGETNPASCAARRPSGSPKL